MRFAHGGGCEAWGSSASGDWTSSYGQICQERLFFPENQIVCGRDSCFVSGPPPHSVYFGEACVGAVANFCYG
jgi:hypothetical protein